MEATPSNSHGKTSRHTVSDHVFSKFGWVCWPGLIKCRTKLSIWTLPYRWQFYISNNKVTWTHGQMCLQLLVGQLVGCWLVDWLVRRLGHSVVCSHTCTLPCTVGRFTSPKWDRQNSACLVFLVVFKGLNTSSANTYSRFQSLPKQLAVAIPLQAFEMWRLCKHSQRDVRTAHVLRSTFSFKRKVSVNGCCGKDLGCGILPTS